VASRARCSFALRLRRADELLFLGAADINASVPSAAAAADPPSATALA
jgi:hypothetical protein